MFSVKKVTYLYDIDKQEFGKLAGLDTGVSCDVFHQYQPLSTSENFMRRLVYGANLILVKESSIVTLLFLEVLNPFYIFQMFSFILWFSDEYYYYAAAILAMSVFGIAMTVRQTRKVRLINIILLNIHYTNTFLESKKLEVNSPFE